MNIIVLVKQVPDTAQLPKVVDAVRLLREGPYILNPLDEYAVEEALRLRSAYGGQVTLLTLGEARAAEALRAGLAMGADAAVLLADPAFADGDSLATARALAAAITRSGQFDLILAGRSALDGDTGQTAIQVAALLGLPALSYVARIRHIDPAADAITVERLLDAGREVLASRLPCLLSVVKEINEPRYPSLIGLRKAARIPITTWDAADLGLPATVVGAAGAGVCWPEVTQPPARRGACEFIDGDTPAAIAAALAAKLRAAGAIHRP